MTGEFPHLLGSHTGRAPDQATTMTGGQDADPRRCHAAEASDSA